jgi:hypothetical protein
MCFVWSMNWVFIAQKKEFFIVTAVKTSNLIFLILVKTEVLAASAMKITLF